MTRNVTGFLFLSEIKIIIRWSVEEYGGVEGGRGGGGGGVGLGGMEVGVEGGY